MFLKGAIGDYTKSNIPKGPRGKFNTTRTPFGKHTIALDNGMFTKWHPSFVYVVYQLTYISLVSPLMM